MDFLVGRSQIRSSRRISSFHWLLCVPTPFLVERRRCSDFRFLLRLYFPTGQHGNGNWAPRPQIQYSQRSGNSVCSNPLPVERTQKGRQTLFPCPGGRFKEYWTFLHLSTPWKGKECPNICLSTPRVRPQVHVLEKGKGQAQEVKEKDAWGD